MFKKVIYGTILPLYLATPGLSAEVPIIGEKQVPLNSFASLRVETKVGDQVRWRITPLPIKKESPPETPGRLYFSGIPGAHYQVEVDVINVELAEGLDGKSKPILIWHTGSGVYKFDSSKKEDDRVTPVPPGPQPNPPKPDPPVPGPTDPHAWFIVLEETSKRTPEIAEALDFTFWNTLDLISITGENRYRFFDKDSPTAVKYNYIKVAEREITKARERGVNLSYPLIMAIKSDGTLIKIEPLPNNQTRVKEFVKSVTGK